MDRQAVRFGCGAVLALLIVGVIVIILDGSSAATIAVLTVIAVAVCGTLAVTRGEGFIVAMVRALDRL